MVYHIPGSERIIEDAKTLVYRVGLEKDQNPNFPAIMVPRKVMDSAVKSLLNTQGLVYVEGGVGGYFLTPEGIVVQYNDYTEEKLRLSSTRNNLNKRNSLAKKLDLPLS